MGLNIRKQFLGKEVNAFKPLPVATAAVLSKVAILLLLIYFFLLLLLFVGGLCLTFVLLCSTLCCFVVWQ